MFKTTLIVLLIVCKNSVMGQRLQYGQSVKASLKDPNAEMYFFLKNDSTFRLRIENDKLFQQTDFNNDLKVICTNYGKKEIAVGNEPLYKKSTSYGWLIIGTEHNSLNSRNIVHYREIDGKLQKIQVLMEIQNKFVSDDGLHFIQTNTGIIIWFESHKIIHNSNEEITIVDLDDQNGFNIQHITLNQTAGLLSFTECRIISDTAMAFLGQQYSITPIKKRGGKPNYIACLLLFNKKTGTFSFNQITPKTLFVSKLTTVFYEDRMVCSFLSSSISDQFADSIHIYKIQLEPFFVEAKTSLDLSILNLPKNSNTYSKLKKAHINIWLDYVIPNKEYNTIILEFFSARILNGSGLSAYRKYYFGPIIILNFDQNGNFISNNVIVKTQVSENDHAMFSSYRVVKDSTWLSFYYNELKSPEKERNIVGMRRPITSKSYLVKSNVLLDGTIYKEVILDNQINRELPQIRKAIIKDGDLIMPIRSKRYFRLGRLSEHLSIMP